MYNVFDKYKGLWILHTLREDNYAASRVLKGPVADLLMSGRETLTFLEENNLEVRARLTINTRKWLILVNRLANS